MASISIFNYYSDTNSVEVTWSEFGKPVRCQSYDQWQMDMLRMDVGSLTMAQETVVAEVLSKCPPAPVEVHLVPSSITPRQAKLALLNIGMLDSVETAIAAAGKAAQIEWENAISFERTSPLLSSICNSLGLTSEQLDGLFITASSL